jgi:hypothetical protein
LGFYQPLGLIRGFAPYYQGNALPLSHGGIKEKEENGLKRFLALIKHVALL